MPLGSTRTATDDLIGLVGIDPQPHMDLDRLIELGRIVFLERLDRLSERQRVLGLLFERSAISL